MTISFYKGLTRNPEIRNTPVWVLQNIWKIGRVSNIKFSTNVSDKMLLNAAKFQGYSFYRSGVIKGKQTGVVLPLLPPFPHPSTTHTRIQIMVETFPASKKLVDVNKKFAFELALHANDS